MTERVDEFFKPTSGGKTPGAAVAVVRDGQVLLMKGYGMADISKATPVSPTTLLRLGSVTKPFTAIAILQLVEAGKIELDDRLSMYVTDFPQADRIRISNLISHTAGVPDFVSLEDAKRSPLEFEPGSRISYTNNGYNLLGQVIEKASGQPWDEYLRDHIFAPLGMKSTGFDKAVELAGRAIGYEMGQDGAYAPIADQDVRLAYAAGGLYSTLEDMVRWEQALEAGKLLRRETLERASMPAQLSDGRKAPYGQGWMTTDYRGLREVGHGGDVVGFNTYFARYPDEKFTVIVLSNVGMRPPGPLPDAGVLAHKIAELWLGERMTKAGERPNVRIASSILDTYTGQYKLEAPEIVARNMGSEIVITRQQDRLMAAAKGIQVPLEALSETQFQAAGSPAKLTFVCDKTGPCAKMLISLMGLREFEAFRVEEKRRQ